MQADYHTESRRDQEEGGELDSHEEVIPEEFKTRKVVLGLRVGLLLLQLFSNGEATDIVFVTLFCIAAGTAIAWYGSCRAMPSGHCLNIFVVLAAVRGILGLPGWRLTPVFTLLPHFPASSPSLVGHLASVDVKQNYSFTRYECKIFCFAKRLSPPWHPSMAPLPGTPHPQLAISPDRPTELPLELHMPTLLMTSQTQTAKTEWQRSLSC